MLENRSFDHMLGHLEQGYRRPLTGADGVHREPSDPESHFYPATWHKSYSDVTVDPGHGYDDVMRQLTGTNGNPDGQWSSPYNPTNDGFVWNYATRKGSGDLGPVTLSEIMGCYPAAMLPVLSTLAQEFAVCTRWHCSLPSETWPNRLFAHAGSSFGDLTCDRHHLTRRDRSIYTLLSEAGQAFRIYAGDIPQVLTFHHDVHKHVRHMSHFEHDVVEKGDLPAYTFIEPRHFDTPLYGKANSQHPISRMFGIVTSGYVPLGEVLLAQIYTMLRANPQIWERTLLIVTYDEHGGFYDRVPPPEVAPTGDVAANGFRFDLLGPRVPTIVASPFVKRGTVVTELFDHTSLPRTVREIFGISPGLTPREESARSLTQLLELPEPRDASDQPSLDQYANEDWFPEAEAASPRPLDDFQIQLRDLAATVEGDSAEIEAAELAAAENSETIAPLIERFVEKHYPAAGPSAASPE